MSKKVIPLICDGQSDLIALEDYLNDFFKDSKIKFVIASGDIIGDKNNYNEYLDELIEKAIFKNPNLTLDFSIDDVLMVGHLIDMDGTFTDDSIVELSISSKRTMYFDNKITVTQNVAETIESRKMRRERIDECVKTKTIKIRNKVLPYSIFYMSTNLEHVTQNERNVETQIEKIKMAEEFSIRFDCCEDFIQFLNEQNKSGTNDYFESWNFIKKHSLDKATNLIIFVHIVKEIK